MRSTSRIALAAALVLVCGCSKVVAPKLDKPGDPLTSSLADRNHALRNASAHPLKVVLEFVGSIVTLDLNFQPRVDRRATFFISGPTASDAEPDTVPAYSVLKRIQWLPSRSGGAITSSVAIAMGTGVMPLAAARESAQVFAPGLHELSLQPPDHADQEAVTVRFMAGFTPRTWWAGPDPALWPSSPDGDGHSVEVTNWNSFSTTPVWPPDGRSYFGPDSFATIPSRRRPVHDDLDRRTFYEIYGNRIYARSEGDSVHFGAWVVFINGGYDKDSPYTPLVDPSDPGLPPGFATNPDQYPVLQSLGLVGSPIGFVSQLTVRLPDATIFRAAQTSVYPRFDPFSVFRMPQIAGYLLTQLPGRAYVVARAQDSDGLRDAAIADPIGLVDRVDSGAGTPRDRLDRRQVLTFYVKSATQTLASAANSRRTGIGRSSRRN